MTTARYFAFTLLALINLIAGSASAQDQASYSIPAAMRNEIAASGGAYTSPYTATTSLPNTPATHRVIDKKFVIVMGVLGGAESLRFASRKLVVDNEFAAGAPWVTNVPPNSHLVFKYGGIFAAELTVAYELKKPHSWLPGDHVVRKLWWVYPAAMVAIHTKNGIGNIRTQGPGGCTSIECAEEMQMQ